MNKRTIYTIAIAVIIIAVFFNPFKRRSTTNEPMPYVRSDVISELTGYLTDHHQSPEEYLADQFRDHSIVFVGEFGQVKQQVEVINRAIPELYDRGIRNLGIEFALYEDTPKIDAVLTADTYDEKAVQQILFNRMVIWGFQEYADLFRAAWELNRSLPDGSEPFRMVGLSVPISWQYLENEKQMEDPEIIKKLYAQGIPDVFMADTIIREFVQRDERALIYVSMQHAFTRFVTLEYGKKAREMGLSDDRRAGNIVYDRIGSKAMTVLFHSPWPYQRSQTLLTFPADGVIDRLMEDLPEDLSTAGFDTVGTPFGDIDADRNDFASGYEEDLVLSDLCDGYIITGPIGDFKTVTPIPEFIDESNIDEAITNFPGPNMEPVTPAEMNTYIANIVESRKNLFERF